jgi:NEDD8-activating enzyme E1 regulatory subunit
MEARLCVAKFCVVSSDFDRFCVTVGIGQFTILDSARVTPQDAGNNFFLHRDSIGKSRAEESVQFLLELNDSVKGTADTSVSIPLFLHLHAFAKPP